MASSPELVTPIHKLDGQAARYLTPAQVAERWQVDPSTVYRLADSDPSLPATKLGRSIRFRLDRLEAWEADRTQGLKRKASRTAETPSSEPDQVGAAVGEGA